MAARADVAPVVSSRAPFASAHVVSADTPIAREVQRRLEAAGVSMTRGAMVPEDATNVIWLTGLPAGDVDPDQVVRKTFQQLREFGRRHRAAEARIVMAFDTGGEFGLNESPDARATLAALGGLAKTAAREWPRAKVQVIDLATEGREPEEVGAQFGAELLRDSADLEVGLTADGRRVVPQLQAVSARSSGRALTPGGVWVVSGGARGVTASCLLALTRRNPLRLVLLGRTAIDGDEIPELRPATTDAELKTILLAAARRRGVAPTPRELQQQANAVLAAREARATCEGLRAAGAEVRYEAVDVADARALDGVLGRIRAEWGPVRGVVHAAGVLADKALHEKTDEQFDRVYTTKVHGFRALLAATREDPLEVLCCFSSVAARVGNAGQADYAAANEVLNKLCQVEQRRRGDACLVRAINWGPWDGGMVTAGLRARFAAMGVPLIPRAAGAEVFADIVTGVLPVRVESVVGGLLPSGNATAARSLAAS